MAATSPLPPVRKFSLLLYSFILSSFPQVSHITHGYLSFDFAQSHFSMSVSPFEPISLNKMPSESSFKQQAELARSALKNFNAIRQLDAPGPAKTAFYELVNATVDFNRFIPFFTSHVLFQEIPPAAHIALEDFLSKHPNFEKPPTYSKVAGLNARIQDALQTPAKKGKPPSFFTVL